MSPRTPLLATALLFGSLGLVPAASADPCLEREYPPHVSGGVVGDTWMLAIDTANEACDGGTDPQTYADRTCQWLWGVDCDGIPGEALALADWALDLI